MSRSVATKLTVLSAAILALAGILAWTLWLALAGNAGTTSPLEFSITTNGSAKEVIVGPGPWPGAEQVATVSEAQARLDFQLTLPPKLEGEWAPTAVWVTPTGTPRLDQQSYIYFANGVELSVWAQEVVPRWEAQVAQDSRFVLVNVAGWPGTAHEGGAEVEDNGQLGRYPAAVGWWQNAKMTNLYSETKTMSQLQEVAPLFADPR